MAFGSGAENHPSLTHLDLDATFALSIRNCGGICLSRPGKKRRFAQLSRREFLQYGQGAVLAFLPSGLGCWPFSSSDSFPQPSRSNAAEFHIHPKYRNPRAIEGVLKKVAPDNDVFPTEVYNDRITAILRAWSDELLESPQKTDTLAKVIAADFFATSPSAVLKPGPKRDSFLFLWESEFKSDSRLPGNAFLLEWRKVLSRFTKLLTVELQITGIHSEARQVPQGGDSVSVRTQVRYEFVGTGEGYYREQWIGHLDLQWDLGSEIRLRSWRNLNESRGRSLVPIFEDRAQQAFSRCDSYREQFLHGVDHWRTVLDGASGVDIYGHNGVAVGDLDGDGFDDLYISQPAGIPNRLYRNRGDGTFEDITESSGVGLLDNTACALFADVDNDGRQDLIVVRAAGPLLFLNRGGGKFRQRPDAFRFENPPQGTFTGAAIADYDRDGWLDIYFCLYAYYQGADQYRYPTPYYAAENGPPNFLFKNNRDGSFRDVTRETGLDKNNTRFSFCCAWADFNDDGWPDLYVVNDFGRKNLYRNNGNGTFTDIAKTAGVEDVGAGMSVSWLDYDNNSRPGLYIADMWTAAGLRISAQENFQGNASEEVRALYRRHAMGNCLYRNQGSGKFEDQGSRSGTLMGRWAWSSDTWDLDHDGFPEIYIANGMISGPERQPDLNGFFWRQVVANSPESSKPAMAYEQGWNAVNELIRADATWSGYERNVLYLNNSDGTFSDISGAAGMDFLEDSRTFVFADFDHDGRVEIVLKNRSAPQLRYLKNVIPQLSSAIAFRLTGKKSNRDAIGAAVTIETGAGHQTRFVQAGSGFLAQHSKELFFGLGADPGKVTAAIHWPSGQTQLFDDLPANHRISVEEGSTEIRKEPFRASPSRKEENVSASGIEFDELPSQVETWLLVPVAAPDFSICQTGTTLDLVHLRGKPALVYFASAKQPDWSAQLEALQRLYEQSRKEAFQLVVLNVTDENEAATNARAPKIAGTLFPVITPAEETVAVYNLLYGRLFDRHRDMSLPTAFLLDTQGDIVKIYQGRLGAEHVAEDLRQIPKSAAERISRGLPFRGVSDTYDVGRNYLSFGAAFYDRGYMNQAEAYFRLAEKDDPTSAEALYGLGSVYLEQKKSSEARDYLERAIRARADYPGTLPNAWNDLGILSAREGKTADAVEFFQKALQSNPDHAVALQNLGIAYRQQKDWAKAETALTRVVALRPDDPEANYNLGMVYAQLNDTERAYKYLQKAVAARPAYPEALNNLGILYLRTRRTEQAKQCFQDSIRLAPAYNPSYLNLARVYAIEGDKARARETLEQLLEVHPDDAQAKRELEALSQ
jgi:tetratricopeptide (TPR) repeat protein